MFMVAHCLVLMQLTCMFATDHYMEPSFTEFLHEQQLRATPCRHEALHLFVTSAYARLAKDLEQQLPHYDRVTLYRNLHAFIEKKILHLIPHDGGSAYFGLPGSVRQRLTETSPRSYHPDHVHFTGTACGRTECLPDQLIPSVVLPPNYFMEAVDSLVKGHCHACRS